MNLVPIEFKKQRIMTTKVLAEQYGTGENNIKNNFNNNKERFIEGKHYFQLTGEALREFKHEVNDIDLVAPNVNQLYLWTDRGAARHAKILDTDEAWEVYEALEDSYFSPNRKFKKELSAMELLKLQYRAIEEQDLKINRVAEKVNSLEDNMPLFNIDCEELQAQVKKIGIAVLGGKNSPAYNDNSTRQKVYVDIQHQLKREFGVNRYKAIKRCQLKKALETVSSYKVPMVLEEEINNLNNQISF